MVKLDGCLQTDDMALATVLSLNGYTPEPRRSKPGDSRVIWVIEYDDNTNVILLENVVNEYIQGECRVEPMEFLRRVRRVRKELYSLLGVTRKAEPSATV